MFNLLKRNKKRKFIAISIYLSLDDCKTLLFIPYGLKNGAPYKHNKYIEGSLDQTDEELFGILQKAIAISRDEEVVSYKGSTVLMATGLKSYKDFTRRWLSIAVTYDTKKKEIVLGPSKQDFLKGGYISEDRLEEIYLGSDENKLDRDFVMKSIRKMFRDLIELYKLDNNNEKICE